MHRHFLFHRFMHRHHGGDCGGWREAGGFDREAYDFHGRRGRHGGFGQHGDFGDWGDMQGGARRGGGRLLGHGDLKLLLLALIEQQPRHGYELIRTIEEMFLGQYSPSPGAIYPTLTMLEERAARTWTPTAPPSRRSSNARAKAPACSPSCRCL